MRYLAGEFRTDTSDVLLKSLRVHGVDEPIMFWMSKSQVKLWKHTQLTVAVVRGRGSSFPLEVPEGVRFLLRTDWRTEEENSEPGGRS